MHSIVRSSLGSSSASCFRIIGRMIVNRDGAFNQNYLMMTSKVMLCVTSLPLLFIFMG